jgi:hypothetical protein
MTMASQDLIIRDVRLKGSRPGWSEFIEIDENTPLSWPIAWARQKASDYNYAYVRLRILAHGFGVWQQPALTIQDPLGNLPPYFTDPSDASQGGGGILFGKDNLWLTNINLLGPLRGWFDWVDLCCCGMAYITPGFEGKIGDGNVFCSRLAQILQAPVRASTATQYYALNGVDFGAWEGTVITYGPGGNVIKVQNSPAS